MAISWVTRGAQIGRWSGGLHEGAAKHSWSLINQMKYQHVVSELHGEQPKVEGLKCAGFIHWISQRSGREQSSLPRTPKQAFNESGS